MNKVLWTATALLLLHAVHSYILLTANVEDLQNIAKRLVQLPIAGHVGSIMRRAYGVFNNHLDKSRNGYDSDIVLGFSPDEQQLDTDYRRKDTEVNVTSPQDQKIDQSKEKEESSQGKSASVYLKKENDFDSA